MHHVIGARDWDLLADDRADLASGALDYRAVRYEDDMPSMFAAADLVVSRAGASTIAELAVVGVAAVLVPLPTLPVITSVPMPGRSSRSGRPSSSTTTS